MPLPLSILVLFLPSPLKILFLRAAGHKAGKNCHIGFSIINARTVCLGDNTFIGHFNRTHLRQPHHSRSYNGAPPSTARFLRAAVVLEDSRLGGPQMRVVQVASGLNAMGIETTVLFTKESSGKLAERLSETGIRGMPLPITRPGKGKMVLARYAVSFLADIFLLYRVFRRERFDLVHVNGAYQFKGAIAGRLAGTPVVWHLNDTGMPGTVKRLFVLIARFCASGFIVAGERVRNYYLKGTGLEGRPCIKIQAPVDTGFFDPEKRTNGGNKSRRRPVSRRSMRILTVANVNPWKGYEHFIEMAAALTQTCGDLQFLAAGGIYSSHTGYFSGLKRMIESKGLENIFFLGRRDDVSALLESADIYVCSSLSEASPMSVWEAMSMEKPVVSTDVGDVRRYIRDGENGFIVPVGDVRAMTEKVRALIEDERMRRTFGGRAREVAVRELDVGICAEKHAVFYRRIAAGR